MGGVFEGLPLYLAFLLAWCFEFSYWEDSIGGTCVASSKTMKEFQSTGARYATDAALAGYTSYWEYQIAASI